MRAANSGRNGQAKYAFVLVMATALAVIVAYSRSNAEDSRAPLNVDMHAQNNSGQDGSVWLTRRGSNVEVAVTLTSEPDGATEPAEIDAGTCAQPTSPALVTLKDIVKNKSLSYVIFPLRATPGSRAIIVRKSVDDATIISCGEYEKL